MKALWEIADFVRVMRRRMRFGELSRAPLQLLRLEFQGDLVECDWIVRPADVWDASLRERDRERNVSEQALRDAITLRDLLFAALPHLEGAWFRAFRQSAAREPPDLVIAGSVTREAPAVFRVSSLAMRAKLYGLRFELEDGVLQALQSREFAIPEVMNEPVLIE
jgi:hypothetical protein